MDTREPDSLERCGHHSDWALRAACCFGRGRGGREAAGRGPAPQRADRSGDRGESSSPHAAARRAHRTVPIALSVVDDSAAAGHGQLFAQRNPAPGAVAAGLQLQPAQHQHQHPRARQQRLADQRRSRERRRLLCRRRLLRPRRADRSSTSSTSIRSRCCADRRARCSARTPRPAPSASRPSGRASSPSTEAEVSGGDYGRREVRASATGPIVDDRLAYRLTYALTERDGYIDNVATGRDVADYENTSVRGQLLFEPTEDLDVRVIGDYSTAGRGMLHPADRGRVRQLRRRHADTQQLHGAYRPQGLHARVARSVRAPRRCRRPLPGGHEELWRLGQRRLGPGCRPHHLDHRVSRLGLVPEKRRRQHRAAGIYEGPAGERAAAVQPGAPVRQRRGRRVRLCHGRVLPVAAQRGAQQHRARLRTRPTGTCRPCRRRSPTRRSTASATNPSWHPKSTATRCSARTCGTSHDRLDLTTGIRFSRDEKQGEFETYWVSGTDLSTLPPEVAVPAFAIRSSFNPQQQSFTTELKDDSISGLVSLSYELTDYGARLRVRGDRLEVRWTQSRGAAGGGRPGRRARRRRELRARRSRRSFSTRGSRSTRRRSGPRSTITRLRSRRCSRPQRRFASTSRTPARSGPAASRSDLDYDPNDFVSLNAAVAWADAYYVDYTDAQQAAENLNLGRAAGPERRAAGGRAGIHVLAERRCHAIRSAGAAVRSRSTAAPTTRSAPTTSRRSATRATRKSTATVC